MSSNLEFDFDFASTGCCQFVYFHDGFGLWLTLAREGVYRGFLVKHQIPFQSGT